MLAGRAADRGPIWTVYPAPESRNAAEGGNGFISAFRRAAPCMISDRKRMGFGCSVLSHRRERRLKLVLINSGIKPTEEISAERDEEGE